MRRATAAILSGIALFATALPAPAAEGFPPPTRITLPNGLTILVVPRHHLPMVTVRAVIRAGGTFDPPALGGLAETTAELLKRGTHTRTAPALAAAVDFLGAHLETEAGADASAVTLTALRRDLGEGLGLVADVLQHPAFSSAELKRVREEKLAGLKSTLDDPNEVVRLAYRKAVLGNHPYGRMPSLKSVAKISREDIQGFYQRYYKPGNTFLLVVGDVEPADVQQRVTQALGRWAPQTVVRPVLPPLTPAPSRVVLVDMDVNQSFVMAGNTAVARGHADRTRLGVLNFILGGDFTSRLNQTIRDKQGLAYGASSRFAMWQGGGTFVANLNTKTESTAAAIESLMTVLSGVQQAPVQDEELSNARAYLTGAFPRRFETNADYAEEIESLEMQGLGVDELTTYRDRVRAVTPADLQRVGREHLPVANPVWVVVARAKAVAGALARFGKVETWPKERVIQ